MPIPVSLETARRMLLACQGLTEPRAKAATKRDALAAIRRMQLLQIDTISVVARSPYLVLYSRVGGYDPRWLDELLAEGKLFEYWAHAACFIAIEDYPLFASLVEHAKRRSWKKWQQWADAHPREVEHVRSRIVAEGALKSSDFQSEAKRGTWWDWKVEKLALEYLFVTGELMIARREGFQRVYDLRERVLPGWDRSQLLQPADVYRKLVEKSALALGVATAQWLREYYYLYQKDTDIAIRELLESGDLVAVALEGTREAAYVHRSNLSLLRKAQRSGPEPTRTELLSPFDPVVWDRARAQALFGFEYRIECYTLQHKRKYGYFTLPVLHNGALVGRLDPKAHRREGIFEVKSLHLEPSVRLGADDWAQLAYCIKRCADWHRTPEVVVSSTSPTAALAPLKRALKKVAQLGDSLHALNG